MRNAAPDFYMVAKDSEPRSPYSCCSNLPTPKVCLLNHLNKKYLIYQRLNSPENWDTKNVNKMIPKVFCYTHKSIRSLIVIREAFFGS